MRVRHSPDTAYVPIPAAARRVGIVVPAHDEGAVIDRLLTGLLEEAGPGELDVVVVCNGCSDDTAERARRHGPDVRVVETPVPSKTAALRLGDEVCLGYPRAWVDADVELRTADVRALACAVVDGLLVAVPDRTLDRAGCPWSVRAYLSVWEELPTVRLGLFGRGVLMMSEQGHARVADLPTVMADDLWIHHAFAATEAVVVAGATVVVRAPRTLADLVRRRTRVVEGARQVQAHPQAGPGRSGTSLSDLRVLASTRRDLWPQLVVFGAVTVVARARATVDARAGRTGRWHRDESSRVAR